MSETLGPRASRPHLRERAGGTPAVLATGLRVDAARRGIARRFRDLGVDTPDLDARILVGHALGLDHTALALAGERRLEAAEIARIEMLAVRRLDREPIARITGTKEFWGLPLRVTPDVLVPRPETETVVEPAVPEVCTTAFGSRLASCV